MVIALLRLDLIDSSKVAIFGNSAGGLTAINALCEGDLFKVAICKYPVLDLNDMHQKTHRFEKGYLNSLIGCLLYTSPSPRDATLSRMPSSA